MATTATIEFNGPFPAHASDRGACPVCDRPIVGGLELITYICAKDEKRVAVVPMHHEHPRDKSLEAIQDLLGGNPSLSEGDVRGRMRERLL